MFYNFDGTPERVQQNNILLKLNQHVKVVSVRMIRGLLIFHTFHKASDMSIKS